MTLNPTIIWLSVGFAFCVAEAFLPSGFIEFAMGISALLVAVTSLFLPLNLQVLLWMVLSGALIWFSRRFVHDRAGRELDSTEAETLTEIRAGEVGRVLYEGNSWAARCDDVQMSIASQQKVYVVGRQGTTLIVMPQHLLHS
jgi:membrane protein implicated in regulation of membrane protease activity